MNPVLIKLSGESLFGSMTSDSTRLISSVTEQIKILQKTNNIGLVIGGGNFFRASKQGLMLNLHQPTADAVGMLATVMNGLILQDFFKKIQVKSEILGAFEISGIIKKASNESINNASAENKIIIFVGGTGNPFFTTDTCAILRALEIGAKIVLKATNVDGIYDSDPKNNPSSKRLKQLSYNEFIEKNLQALDITAISLAKQHGVKIRVFNIFADNALCKAVNDLDFGSTIG